MWLILLLNLLQYLPKSETPIQNKEDEEGKTSDIEQNPHDHSGLKYERSNGMSSTTPKKNEAKSPSLQSNTAVTASMPGYLFAEKLVPLLVNLFLKAPTVEKYIIYPEIIQGLGRSMTTRRENPDGSLWRLSVEGFNRILDDGVCQLAGDGGLDFSTSKPARTRIWKEIADLYEIFLVGYCGRALPSDSLSTVVAKADESLELTTVHILGDKVLTSPVDAPYDISQRLISTLDRCASRTCSLPVETVERMPLHCCRFSLTCLQKLFSLARVQEGFEHEV